MLNEFKDFITTGNLVDLAIAVVLAMFFTPVIDSIVGGVILNLVAALFGQPNFDSVARLKVRDAGADPMTDPATYLEFGQVITALVTFLIVGFVCFLIVKAYNTMIKKEEEVAGPTEVELLGQIRDQLAANNR